MAGVVFFSNIKGQNKVLGILERLIAADRFLPLVFVGQSGVGKRTVALKLAQAINCEKIHSRSCSNCSSCQKITKLTHPDIRLIFPIHKSSADSKLEDTIAEMIKQYPNYTLDKSQPSVPGNYVIPITAIRWIASEINKPPVSARKRCYIILNAHRMNAEAQNALLKIIEEPKRHTLFILTTINQHALYPTIRSRCQIVRFANFSDEDLISYLRNEAITGQSSVSESYLSLIATVAHGSLGKALSIYRNFEEANFIQVLNFIKNLNQKTLPSIIGDFKNTEPSLIIHIAIQKLLKYLYNRLNLNFPEQQTRIRIILEMLSYLYEKYHQGSLNVNPLLADYCTLRKLYTISKINTDL